MNTALAALHGVQALSEQADAFSFGVLTPEPERSRALRRTAIKRRG